MMDSGGRSEPRSAEIMLTLPCCRSGHRNFRAEIFPSRTTSRAVMRKLGLGNTGSRRRPLSLCFGLAATLAFNSQREEIKDHERQSRHTSTPPQASYTEQPWSESDRRHRRCAQRPARRLLRALHEDKELSLARLGTSFPRLSPPSGRTR